MTVDKRQHRTEPEEVSTKVLSTNLSQKIRAISPLLMLLVVLVHARNIPSTSHVILPSLKVALVVEEFISNGVARLAVPVYFAIAGYLFFTGYDGSWQATKRKWISRSKSLVLPYFIWSAFWLLILFAAASIPFLARYFIYNPRFDVRAYSTSRILFTLLLDPVPYPLWFIRELIYMVAIAPLIYAIRKQLPLVLLAVAIWYLSTPPNVFVINEYVIYRADTPLFFILGACLVLRNVDTEAICLHSTYLVVAWIGLLTFRIVLDLSGVHLNWLHQATVISGAAALWSAFDRLKSVWPLLGRYAFLTFFVFASHSVPLTAIQNITKAEHQTTTASALMLYFGCLVATLTLCCVAGVLLRKTMPKLYYYTTGGR